MYSHSKVLRLDVNAYIISPGRSEAGNEERGERKRERAPMKDGVRERYIGSSAPPSLRSPKKLGAYLVSWVFLLVSRLAFLEGFMHTREGTSSMPGRRDCQ